MNKLAIVLSLCATCSLAQSSDNPISAAVKAQYTNAKTNLLKAAEKMPEESYAFRPVDDVRTFGQIVAHVANANYMFCSAALGEQSPNTENIEKTKTAKADLVQALTASFEYCDKAYNSLTDVTAAEKVKVFRGEQARIGALTLNNMHDYEHYGNIVTYMRMKNIVPPSSEGR
jgi:uncharacterized damage-inducible protein DinB